MQGLTFSGSKTGVLGGVWEGVELATLAGKEYACTRIAIPARPADPFMRQRLASTAMTGIKLGQQVRQWEQARANVPIAAPVYNCETQAHTYTLSVSLSPPCLIPPSALNYCACGSGGSG